MEEGGGYEQMFSYGPETLQMGINIQMKIHHNPELRSVTMKVVGPTLVYTPTYHKKSNVGGWGGGGAPYTREHQSRAIGQER